MDASEAANSEIITIELLESMKLTIYKYIIHFETPISIYVTLIELQEKNNRLRNERK